MSGLFSRFLWLLLATASWCTAELYAGTPDLRSSTFMEELGAGFEHVYNLEYEKALQVFFELESRYPDHPSPPLSQAAVLWLELLLERQELDLDRFLAPGYFTRPPREPLSEEKRQAFMERIERSRELSEGILGEHPNHTDALYILGSTYGVEGAFTVTIERNTRPGIRLGRQAYQLHRNLVKLDPEYWDAYMSVGVYEYIVGNLPWYLRWLAALAGYRGNAERGLDYLGKAAERGRYAGEDARVLQMVLFVREERKEKALGIAQRLHSRYPKNFIFHINQAQILERMNQRDDAVEIYLEVLSRAEQGFPNYQKLDLSVFRYQLGRKFFELGRPELAKELLRASLDSEGTPERERALSHLKLGRILDLMGESESAVVHYREVLELPDVENSHRRARELLRRH